MRLVQKASELAPDRRLLLAAVRRSEPLQIGAGRNHRHALGLVVIVQAVLFLDLLRRAGHHETGGTQGFFLGGDAPVHVVAFVDDLLRQPRC